MNRVVSEENKQAKQLMHIAGRAIGEGKAPYIIAEIGINHNGDRETAMRLIREAKRSGADAVKFQIITADLSYVKGTESHAIFKRVEFSDDDWRRIIACAEEERITFFATFVNRDDIERFKHYSFPCHKISSSNVTNTPLLDVLIAEGKPLIVSTGMCYQEEVDDAMTYLREKGAREIALLHCISLYPTKYEEANLNVIDTFRQRYPDIPVGFSDHTKGYLAALAAIAKGAAIIEKHFTLDTKMEGPDHHFSATPDEMAYLVQYAKDIFKTLGSPAKKPVALESKFRENFRRYLVASRNITAGEVFEINMLSPMRSRNTGIEPKEINRITGKKSRRDIKKFETITSEDCVHE